MTMTSYENEMECEWTEMCVRDISGGKEKKNPSVKRSKRIITNTLKKKGSEPPRAQHGTKDTVFSNNTFFDIRQREGETDEGVEWRGVGGEN